MIKDRWEHGSEFHWLDFSPDNSASHPWGRRGIFFGSGRDAFRALICNGRKYRGWKRLWIPSYFCQEVVTSFLSTDIKVLVYVDAPFDEVRSQSDLHLKPGDVLLKANFFGLGETPDYTKLDLEGVEIIEDHTHDPWSDWALNSNADWCIASLRKILPVPEGGVLWSPVKHTLPDQFPTTEHRKLASLHKFVGMVLKCQYLNGHAIGKDVFRRLMLKGEEHISDGEISGITEWTYNLLTTFPVEKWRKCKLANYQLLRDNLQGIEWLGVLGNSNSLGRCPFSTILLFDTQQRRERVRKALIENNIYPAILWSMEQPVVRGIPYEHVTLSRRMLSIHCDMRYNDADMMHVASLIRKLGDEYI